MLKAFRPFHCLGPLPFRPNCVMCMVGDVEWMVGDTEHIGSAAAQPKISVLQPSILAPKCAAVSKVQAMKHLEPRCGSRWANHVSLPLTHGTGEYLVQARAF